jgi:hypothetical protein
MISIFVMLLLASLSDVLLTALCGLMDRVELTAVVSTLVGATDIRLTVDVPLIW